MLGFVFVTNAQQAKKNIQGDYGNTVIVKVSEDSQTSSTLEFYNNSEKSIRVCVKVYNTSSEVGHNCYNISGNARGEEKSLSKMNPCKANDFGCEVKGIEITSAEVIE